MMTLGIVWLAVVLAASWSGWLFAGRTEVATLLMGAGMVMLSGLEFLATESGRRLRIMPACGLVAGAGLLCAGVFDRLDINRFNSMADWLTGFVFGSVVASLMLAGSISKDGQDSDGFAVGDIPLPHWDAIWISLGFAFWQLVDEGVIYWYAMQGADIPEWARVVACSMAWVLVAAVVQLIRFGRFHSLRLLLAAAGLAILFLVEHAEIRWLSLGVGVMVFWILCCAGGSYPMRWPSGTFTDGLVQLRGWVLTGLIALFMTTNISGSLTNRTVTEIVETHGRLAPVSDESFMRLVMDDAYLWHYEVSSGGIDASDSRPLLKGMRVAQRDRFSVAWTNDSRFGQPERKGNPGVFLSRQGGQTFVAHVIPGSPADKAGVVRGWRFLPIHSGNEDSNKARVFAFAAPGNVQREVGEMMESEALVDFRVDAGSGQRIGYLYLDRFKPEARVQLDKAFAEFNKAKIEELVIDLRYNPGGAVFVVDHLASLVAGNAHAGEVLYRLSNNTKYTDADDVGRFKHSTNGLDIARVFVLTSEHSCSASELLMVSLRTFMPVIAIGEVTCGKPVGSRGVRFGNQTFRVLSFRASNARGQGFYNDGLVPHCFKADDLTQSFRLGTQDDPMFRIAQNYMEFGQCELLKR